MARAAPEHLIARAIELLHKARAALDRAGAGEAVTAVERTLTAATFARGAALQARKEAEKTAATVPQRNKGRRR